MKLLYEAANTVEAHMIINLLEQSNLTSRIDGEFLQGGAGELQAFGTVRVMIKESNYDEAAEVIKLWESMAPNVTDDQTPELSKGMSSSEVQCLVLGLMVGFVCGIVATIFSF